MKRILLVSVILMLSLLMEGQVTMQLQVPPLGLTIKPQLWNLSLVNASHTAYAVRIEMTMTDISNNQRVLSGSTKTFILGRGAMPIQVKDVVPITYNSGTVVSIDPSPDGFLPLGIYNICYTLIRNGKDLDETIAEVCETFEIEPLSPPQLISPADQEKVELLRPMFSWLPPAPVNTFAFLLYDMIVVEVQPTQSPADAIQMNPPVFSRQRITLTNLQYPQAAPMLDTGKVYAWRVSARNNQVLTAHSEIASFTIVNEKIDNITEQKAMYYSRLQPTEDAAFALCKGLLRFEYNNQNNQQQLQYKLFDISNNSRSEISTGGNQQPLRYGQNYLELDLRKLSGIVKKHFYLLEVIGAGADKWYLKFEYREP